MSNVNDDDMGMNESLFHHSVFYDMEL